MRTLEYMYLPCESELRVASMRSIHVLLLFQLSIALPLAILALGLARLCRVARRRSCGLCAMRPRRRPHEQICPLKVFGFLFGFADPTLLSVGCRCRVAGVSGVGRAAIYSYATKMQLYTIRPRTHAHTQHLPSPGLKSHRAHVDVGDRVSARPRPAQSHGLSRSTSHAAPEYIWPCPSRLPPRRARGRRPRALCIPAAAPQRANHSAVPTPHAPLPSPSAPPQSHPTLSLPLRPWSSCARA